MKIKRTRADAAFSLAVRWRSRWRCEGCGRQLPVGAQNLHCSHLVGRRHAATRFHPDAAVAHCFGCHQYLGENPVAFTAWIRNRYGQARVDDLSRLSRVIHKRPKNALILIAKHFEGEAERMEAYWTGRPERFGAPQLTDMPQLMRFPDDPS